MGGEIVISGCLLLVNVHISQMAVEVGTELIPYAGEQSVLIECIVYGFAAEI